MPSEFSFVERATVPTIITEIGAPELENSELRQIANDVLQAAKYAFVSVVANPNQAVPAGSLAEAFKAGLDNMEPAKRDRLCQRVSYLAETRPEVREILFGRYGQLSSQEFLDLGVEQAREKLEPLTLDPKLLGVKTAEVTLPLDIFQETPEGLLIPKTQLPAGFQGLQAHLVKTAQQASQSEVFNAERLAEIWGPLPTATAKPQHEIDGSLGIEIQSTTVPNYLRFCIARVKCVDETSPEWPGSDEITLGGISIDETGDTKKISATYIGGGFDDGNQKTYSPPWQYHSFSLLEGLYWPKAYAVSLILAEEDNGGMSKFLDQVWVKVDEHVKGAVQKAVTGVLQSYVGPAIAAAIGKAAAWAVDKLVGWLIDTLKDDLFPIQTTRLTVPHLNARWNYPDGRPGSLVSPLQQAHFYGHGGHYYVEYYWQLA